MPNSSDWIVEAGSVRSAPVPQEGWLAALTLEDAQADGGFRDISPFAPLQPSPQPAPSSEGAASEGRAPLNSSAKAKRDMTLEDEADLPPQPPVDIPPDPQELAYERGFAEGQALAKQAGEEALAIEQGRYRELRLAFRALDQAAMEALAQDLNATVLALCNQVLDDYALDNQALIARCHKAAKRLGAGPSELTLHLNPETRAQLSPDALGDWAVADDASLAPGSLKMTSGDSCAREGPDDWARAIAEALGA